MENKDEILRQLEAIIESRTFRQAKRLCALLRFSVEETLAGRATGMTAPIIALEIFSSDGTIDARAEGLVRVQARQLRMKLSSYYEGEGRDDPIRISIPQGAYSAVFETMRVEPAVPVPSFAAIEIDGIDIGVAGITGAAEDAETDLRLKSTQQHLVTFLARFADVRTLWLEPDGGPPLEGEPPRADLILSGRYCETGKTSALTMNLFCGRRHDLIWSHRFEQETHEVDDAWYEEVARRTAIEIASSSSPVIFKRLRVWRELRVRAHPVTEALLRIRRYAFDPSAEAHLRLRADFEAILKSGDRRPEVLWSFARLLIDERRFAFNRRGSMDDLLPQAEDLLLEALRSDPSSADAWSVLSMVAFEFRDHDRARVAMDHALKLNPLQTDAIATDGTMLWNLGETEAGLAQVERAISLREHPPGWYLFPLVHEAIRTRRPADADALIVKIGWPKFFWTRTLSMVSAGLAGNHERRDALRADLAIERPKLIELIETNADETTLPFPEDFRAALHDGTTCLPASEDAKGISAAVTTLRRKARPRKG